MDALRHNAHLLGLSTQGTKAELTRRIADYKAALLSSSKNMPAQATDSGSCTHRRTRRIDSDSDKEDEEDGADSAGTPTSATMAAAAGATGSAANNSTAGIRGSRPSYLTSRSPAARRRSASHARRGTTPSSFSGGSPTARKGGSPRATSVAGSPYARGIYERLGRQRAENLLNNRTSSESSIDEIKETQHAILQQLSRIENLLSKLALNSSSSSS